MSYINPNIPIIETPTGLLAALQAIQIALGESLPWLDRSFGRAYLMPEKRRNVTAQVPKVYAGKGEYYCVLPNDAFAAYSFLQVLSSERTRDYEHTTRQNAFEVKVGLVFYLNLKKIRPANSGAPTNPVIDDVANTFTFTAAENAAPLDYIYTDLLKNDVLKVLKAKCTSFKLAEIQDESPRQIFEGYQIKDLDDTLIMYPKAAFRFTGTLIYQETC